MQPIVVIGGGLMGSATAWHLARQGEQVILLEQQDAIYVSGSSYGEARISRSLGPEDDIYAFLQIRGIKETQLLIDFLNKKEPNSHAMADIYTTSPVTYLFYSGAKETDVFNLDEPSTLESGDEIVLAMNPSTAKEKFKLNAPDSVKVIREYRQYSGTMNPSELIHKLHKAIKYTNNEIRYGQRIHQLIRTAKGYELTVIDNETKTSYVMEAKKIVAAAGPYTGHMLKQVSPKIDKQITPMRLGLSFFKIKKKVYERLEDDQKQDLIAGFPLIKLNQGYCYAMIEKFDQDGLPIIKVGGHFKRTPIRNLNEVWKIPIPEEEKMWSKRELVEYLNMVGLAIKQEDLEFYDGYSCVYSLTKSEVPYVTNLPMVDGTFDKNSVLVGGMSGIGAKGAMTYGHIAANLLLGKEGTNEPIYSVTKNALGNERLLKDLAELRT